MTAERLSPVRRLIIGAVALSMAGAGFAAGRIAFRPVEDVSQRLFIILQQYRDQNTYIAIAPDWKTWGEKRAEGWDDWFKKGHSKVDALARELAGNEAGPVEKAEAIRLGLRDRLRTTHVSRFHYQDTPDEELESGSTSSGGVAALATLMPASRPIR